MGTFIELQTDAFADNLNQIQDQKRDFSGVRRPYRGFEIKEDTYAVIKVIRSDGTEIPLTDAGGARKPQSGSQRSAGSGIAPKTDRMGTATTYNYSNFIIQRIDESRQEKSQILETFGDTFIFFFGERPRVLQVSGLLMNTLDFNWRTEFWFNYEHVLRGTKLVEQNARIYLYWDDLVVEGYMLQATARDDSEMPYHIPFSFSLFVTNHMYLSQVGSDDYPITHAVNLQPLLTQKDVLSAKRLLKKRGIAAAELVSTTQAVRDAAEASEFARQQAIAGGTLSPNTAQSFSASKNLLRDALAFGLHGQNLTFLSLANRYFRQRKMRFPRGLAGSETYAGPPQIANQPSAFPFQPQRTKPLRSKIRDNVDEYVKSGALNFDSPANLDQDAIIEAQLAAQYNTPYLLEKQLLADLAAVGADPIQHPGGNPLGGVSHGMTVVAALAAAKLAAFAQPKIPSL